MTLAAVYGKALGHLYFSSELFRHKTEQFWQLFLRVETSTKLGLHTNKKSAKLDSLFAVNKPSGNTLLLLTAKLHKSKRVARATYNRAKAAVLKLSALQTALR